MGRLARLQAARQAVPALRAEIREAMAPDGARTLAEVFMQWVGFAISVALRAATALGPDSFCFKAIVELPDGALAQHSWMLAE